jgi:hypothetical protein
MTKYSIGVVVKQGAKRVKDNDINQCVWTPWLTKSSLLKAVASMPADRPVKVAVR